MRVARAAQIEWTGPRKARCGAVARLVVGGHLAGDTLTYVHRTTAHWYAADVLRRFEPYMFVQDCGCGKAGTS
jgi:hypothetical protein